LIKIKTAPTEMARLLTHGSFVVEIPDSVIQAILDIYPDEKLYERKVFTTALETGSLTYQDLVKECEVLHLPWQIFLLKDEKVLAEIAKIDTLRKSKFDLGKVANRAGSGQRVSMRLLDRIIALQQFGKEKVTQQNAYCGALQSVSRDQWIPHIVEYFGIDTQKFHSLNKEKALEYLIGCLETKNVRVSRGVLSNKILPASRELQKAYRQSSGFVVQDQALPYIFLPNEINRDETAGRQLYTLISLLLLVGLGEYNILVSSDFAARVNGDRITRRIHGAVTELLLPFEATNLYRNQLIDAGVRDDLATNYKLTPTAVVITLLQRGVITSDECEALLASIAPKPASSDNVHFNNPKLTTSIQKFCGKFTNENIVVALSDKSLNTTRAQYLLFGHIDKKRFHDFKEMNNI